MEKSVEELEKTWELCQGIDISPDGAGLETGLLEPTACLLGAETAVFRVFSSGIPRPTTVVGLGICDSVHDAYLNRYFRLDPARRVSMHRLARPLVTDHDRSRREAWLDDYVATIGKARGHRSVGSMRAQHEKQFRQYKSQFLLPNNFYHHLGFCFQDPSGRQTFLLDFHRAQAWSPFGRLEFARAKIIAMLLHAKAAQLSPAISLGDHSRVAADREDDAINERCRGVDNSFGTRGFDRRLSARELEVANAVALGLTNKEVGEVLSISVRTVENHMRSIFAKLGIKTRTRLAAELHELRPNASVTRTVI
jgi:DNA-binding CsgD family transcriptional regulator